jgi:hypothetical protein
LVLRSGDLGVAPDQKEQYDDHTMNQELDNFEEDLCGPLPAGFDEFASDDNENGVLNAWLGCNSDLYHAAQSGIRPRNLVWLKGLAREMRQMENLAQAKAMALAAQEQAQAVADLRAQADGLRHEAADQPRAEHVAGHALADQNLTPRLLAQRPFIARVTRGQTHAC